MSLDVLVQTNIDFESAWDRKETKSLDGVAVYILSVPDLIAMKEDANREQDRADVINLKKYYKKSLLSD